MDVIAEKVMLRRGVDALRWELEYLLLEGGGFSLRLELRNAEQKKGKTKTC